jgi:hypothetical protein
MRKTLRPAAPLEHQEQAAVVLWWGYSCARYDLPDFALYAVPNAGAGAQKGQAGKMKAEGVRKGIPDLCLAVPRGRRHGLYIEMKRARGGSGVSEDQALVQAYLEEQGYDVVVAYGADQAMDAIRRYLERQ